MHHKNIYRISDQMYYRRQNQRQVVVLWADRNAGTYCSHLDADHPNDDTEHYCTYLACVCYKRQVVHIMDPVTHNEGNAEQYRAFMAITLAHETAHSLGCSEAYDTAGHETSIWNCVMQKFATSPAELLAFYNQLSDDNPKAFCSTCITELSGSIPSEGIS